MKLATLATTVALSLIPVLSNAQEMITDLDGREVMIHGTPDRVALGFYYEDYLAVTGPEGAAKLVSLSRAPWADWRPGQWAAYTKVFPALETLPDFGNADDNTFSVEALIASKPDVAFLSTWQTAAIGAPRVKQIEDAGKIGRAHV